MQNRAPLPSHGREPMLGHHRLERGNRGVVEAAQVAVERIEARHYAASQVHEQRVGRQRLDTEYSVFADCRRVHEEPELSLHRVDNHRTRLEAPELIAQRLIDAEIPHERTEPGETAVTGQPRVRPTNVDVARVSTSDPARASVPIAALATNRISAHLLGARWGCCCIHRRNTDAPAEPSFQEDLCPFSRGRPRPSEEGRETYAQVLHRSRSTAKVVHSQTEPQSIAVENLDGPRFVRLRIASEPNRSK